MSKLYIGIELLSQQKLRCPAPWNHFVLLVDGGSKTESKAEIQLISYYCNRIWTGMVMIESTFHLPYKPAI